MQTAATASKRVSSSSSPFSFCHSSSNFQKTLTDISSFSSILNENVKNSKVSIQIYLLKFQQNLKEFKKNLKIMPASSIGSSSARDSEFQDKLKYLNSSCDQLIKFLDSGKFIKIIEEKSGGYKSDRIYDRHISNLHNGFIEYQTENGKLKHRLAEIDTKICEILNENNFLRWENEQYKIEMDGLRDQMDKENLLTKELKAEICCLKLNQNQINHIHSVKLKDELSTAAKIAKTEEESLKKKFENFEKESKLKEMEYCRKMKFMGEEINEKTNLLKKYEKMIDDLTDENYRVAQIFGNTKNKMEEEIQRFYEKEKNLELKLTAIFTNLSTFDYCKSPIPYPSTTVSPQHDSESLQHLQNQMSEIILNNNSSSGKDSKNLQNLLNEKTLQIFDLRERIVFLEEECRAVKNENRNSNILLQQMIKDIKILLEIVQENNT